MKSRVAQLLFLAAFLAVAYAVSGLNRTPTDVVSGLNRTPIDVVSGFSRTPSGATSRTHTPAHDDGVWQSARQITTTSGASFQIGKHELRAVTIAPRRTLAAGRTQIVGESGGTSRDRSPQHSIPLLI